MKLENGQENQEIKSNGHGGARPNAGRKPMHGGEETTRKMRRKFNEYVTEEQIEAIVAGAVADAMDGKEGMQKFVLEQVFGKATQRNEHAGADGEPLVLQMAESIIEKYAPNTKAEPNS